MGGAGCAEEGIPTELYPSTTTAGNPPPPPFPGPQYPLHSLQHLCRRQAQPQQVPLLYRRRLLPGQALAVKERAIGASVFNHPHVILLHIKYAAVVLRELREERREGEGCQPDREAWAMTLLHLPGLGLAGEYTLLLRF